MYIWAPESVYRLPVNFPMVLREGKSSILLSSLFYFARFLTITVCTPYIITSIAICRILWRIKVVKSSTWKLMNCKMNRTESWMTWFSIVLCTLCFPGCIPVLLCSLSSLLGDVWVGDTFQLFAPHATIWGEEQVSQFFGRGFFAAEWGHRHTVVTNLKHSQKIKTSPPTQLSIKQQCCSCGR